nr:MAG: ORF1 [Torque teno midi virus]
MPYFWRYPRYRRRFTRAWRKPRRRFRKPKRRRIRRTFQRRTYYTRTKRRPRRVRKYLRKKKKTIKLVQWQPENIVKCKIIGYQPLISCGQGRQCYNYNQHVTDICLKNESYGGGFTILVLSLDYLYSQWLKYNNIWTRGNNGYDLVRYTGTSLCFYRHPFASFIVSYHLSPPFTVNRETYTNCHPYRLLMQKHKFLVPSLSRKPTGKRWVKKKIKTPKLFMNKWYFQADFCAHPFLMIKASVIGLSTPYLKYSFDNNCVGLTCLNPEIFDSAGFWSATTYPTKLYLATGKLDASKQNYTLTPIKNTHYDNTSVFWWAYLDGTIPIYTSNTTITTGKQVSKAEFEKAIKPLTIQYRYQPTRDTGEDNVVFLESVVTPKIDIPSNKNYKYEGLPLWMLLHGWIDWCSKFFKGDNIYDNYSLCLRCKFLYPIDHTIPPNTLLLPISTYFLQGKSEYGYPTTNYEKNKWAPTIRHQQSLINDICMGGPYSALPSGKSFDLAMKYKCYFKWGGTVVRSQTVNDPENQEAFPLPNENIQRLQIKDPSTQDYKAEFHKWDYRRGMLTGTAIKRALQDSESDPLSSTDSEEEAAKRRRLGEPTISHPKSSISSRVQCLFEETTCQPSQETQEKILKHKLRNHKLKQLILRSLIQMERKQQLMALTTGHIE